MENVEQNPVRRKRGRPKGAKDARPRVYRVPEIDPKEEGFSVIDKLLKLRGPVRANVIAEITGLSEATIRRRVKEGSLPAFQSRGILLLDPDFVAQWWMHRFGPNRMPSEKSKILIAMRMKARQAED